MTKELTPLEALKVIERFIGKNIDNATVDECFDLGFAIGTIENALKTIEVIKEKGVDMMALNLSTKPVCYNKNIVYDLGIKELTKEEFDLLKEVLK